MSIKQKLEWGIFPIASRRHQPRDNANTFHEFSHDYTPDESAVIVASWIATPIVAWLASLFTDFDFGTALILMIFLDLFLIWETKTS